MSPAWCAGRSGKKSPPAMGLGGGTVFRSLSADDEAELAVEEPGAAPPPQPSDARLPARTVASPASAFFMSCPPPTSGVEHALVYDGRTGAPVPAGTTTRGDSPDLKALRKRRLSDEFPIARASGRGPWGAQQTWHRELARPGRCARKGPTHLHASSRRDRCERPRSASAISDTPSVIVFLTSAV